MRILFVDAGQPSGGAYYRSCVKLVSRMVLTQQLVCDTELQLVEAAANNLEDYLYELETSRSSIVVLNFAKLGYAELRSSRSVVRGGRSPLPALVQQHVERQLFDKDVFEVGKACTPSQ